MTFEKDGRREEVSMPELWVFLFGAIYLAYKGVWAHVAIYVVAAILTGGFVWFIYPLFVRAAIKKHYEDQGWKLISVEAVPSASNK